MAALRALITIIALLGSSVAAPSPSASFTVGHYERSDNGDRCNYDLCVNEERGLFVGQPDLDGRCSHDICVPAHQSRALSKRLPYCCQHGHCIDPDMCIPPAPASDDLTARDNVKIAVRWIPPGCCCTSCKESDVCSPPCTATGYCRREEVVVESVRFYSLGSRDNVVLGA